MFSQVAFVRAVVDGFASALVEEDAPGGGGASFGRSSSGGNGSRGRLRLREQTVAEALADAGIEMRDTARAPSRPPQRPCARPRG
jgi:hypothetical protein